MLKNGSKKGFLLAKIDFAFLPTTFIVYRVLVHYRVGSLERFRYAPKAPDFVHYRVGSLESNSSSDETPPMVHYRVGSLEKT